MATARELLARYLPPELRRREVAPLASCLGMRLAAPVRAREDLPPFDRASVDGYAVRAADTFGASEGAPSYLRLVGEVRVGEAPRFALNPGEAAQVATGAMLPEGADSVVMLEYTELLGPGEVEVLRPVGPGENVIRAGEDVRAGAEVLPENHLLRPQDLGILAALGETQLEVYFPLKVGIVSTGDELVPPEAAPGPGKIRDANSSALSAAVRAAGGEPVGYGFVPDDPAVLREALGRALEECDLVLVSGGSSVGARDLTAEVVAGLGEPGVVFHGLAARPGKPTLGAVAGGKPVFGLPGHPAAALLVFDLLVAPLLKWGSYTKAGPGVPPVPARLTRSLASAPGREDFVRVRLRREGAELWAEPLLGKSGLLSPLVEGDGIFRIPLTASGVAAGEVVDVYLFGTDYLL